MGPTILFDSSVYTPGTRHATHEHDTLQLSLVLAGFLTETVGSQVENAQSLSVVAKDPGLAHSDDFAAGATLVRLTFPTETLDTIIGDPSRARPWIWTHRPEVAKPFLELAYRARFGVRRFHLHDEDILDLLAALTARSAVTRGRPPVWLEDTMLELRDSWSPAITVSAVASKAGVHPVYLARCVRRWYGTGLAEELRRLRLQSAARALTESATTVSAIAHRGGFSDESHLCRDFGHTLGVTPRRFRSMVRDLA